MGEHPKVRGGFEVGKPHVSARNPFPHVDVTFKPKGPGQTILPFPKMHVPVDACQPDHRQ